MEYFTVSQGGRLIAKCSVVVSNLHDVVGAEKAQ